MPSSGLINCIKLSRKTLFSSLPLSQQRRSVCSETRYKSASNGKLFAYLVGGAVAASVLGVSLYSFLNDVSLVHAENDSKMSAISGWAPPSRDSLVSSLRKGDQYDLLVIGGGATGAGCALEAASRGLRVALVEREDFSSGTSSKSTKLVHGGVRYLEKAFKEFDYGQYKLVCEALAERSTFLKIAPHLSEPLPILLPIYKWYLVPYFWVGSKVYDLLAGSQGISSSYFLSRSKAIEAFPLIKAESLVGAMVYYDGQHNDSRTNMAVALTSIFHGATAVNHTEVTGLIKESGKIVGAQVKDNISGESFPIFAKGVVNAAGPYCDAVRRLDEPAVQEMVSPSSGVHIVLPDYYCSKNMGLLDPETSDGRVVFVLPWQGRTVAGTTDSPSGLSYDPIPSEKDIQFILDEVSHILDPSIKVRREDVLSAWSGIRPLVKDPSSASSSTQRLVRSHLVTESPAGLLTISGGKWTTFRNMAEETINAAIKSFSNIISDELKPSGPSCTSDLLLIGAHRFTKTSYVDLIQKYGMDLDIARHLCNNYGDRAADVASLDPAGMSSSGPKGRLANFSRLVPDYPFLEAEVRYAMRNEYAQTVVDVMARRTRLSFLNAQAALEAIPKLVSIMASEGGWSKARQADETKHAEHFLASMGLKP